MYDTNLEDPAVEVVESVQVTDGILERLNAKIANAYKEISAMEGSYDNGTSTFLKGVTPLLDGSPLWSEIVKLLQEAPSDSEFQGIGKLYKAIFDAYTEFKGAGLSDADAKEKALETLRILSSGTVDFLSVFGIKVKYVDDF